MTFITGLSIKKDIKEWLDKMGFNILHDPETKEEDGRILVDVFVDDPRKLIGERGANLRSFQALFRQAMTKKYGNVLIDIDLNGYKKKRAEFLRELAHMARKQALNEKHPIELEPMNSFDRRVVHAALTEFHDVRTESTGEREERRVVVHLV